MQTLDEPTRAARADYAPPAATPQLTDAPSPTEKARAGGLPSAAAPSLSALAAAALAACGGGGGDNNTNPSNGGNNTGNGGDNGNPNTNSNNTGNTGDTGNLDTNKTNDTNKDDNKTPVAKPPTEQEAARFLMQASFGGTYAQMQDVQTKGFEAWLDAELAKAWVESDSHYSWIVNSGFIAAGQSSKLGMDNTLWRKLISAPDVLRQRVAFALSQIFVVSIEGLGAINWRNVAAAAYMDLLEKNAFGNFSDLLKAVSLSPAMGTYLNMKGSVAATGNSSPDENYAREVMQLFTIGLYQLNADGSLKSGKPIETYQQQDVTDLAAILTGWNFASAPTFDLSTKAAASSALSYFNSNMTHTASKYSYSSQDKKSNTATGKYIGGNIPANATGQDAINIVIEYLANHGNVGPFIGRQLIQRLVCSNPTPAYIGRVSAAFTKKVNGKRGDMKTIIKAVLLDPEARNLPTDAAAIAKYGKLREPALRLVQWARTFNAKPADLTVVPSAANSWAGPWNIGDLSDDVYGLGQSPLRSPSVFNFYRPGYVPPQGEMGANTITAPEFQICNEVTVAKYLNFMNRCVDEGRNDVKPDYSADLSLAKDAKALVDRYALLLAANALSTKTKTTIVDAITKQSASDNAGRLLRIKAAIFLIMATSEYIIQK